MTKSIKTNFAAAARGVTLQSTANLKVVDYADADKALRVQMEAAIAPIDKAPASRGEIGAYGGDLVQAAMEFYREVDTLSQKALVAKAGMLLPDALELVNELDGHLGCTKEIIRRYDEQHIPAAVRQAAASGAAEDLKNMREVDSARSLFVEKTVLLEGARCLSMVVAQRLELGVEQKEILDIVDATYMGEYMRHHPPEKLPNPRRKAKGGPRQG